MIVFGIFELLWKLKIITHISTILLLTVDIVTVLYKVLQILTSLYVSFKITYAYAYFIKKYNF